MKLDNIFECALTISQLKGWLQKKFNVMLVGPKGNGKSTMARKAALELYGEKGVKYFSASTIDPWCDLIGIPMVADGTITYAIPDFGSPDLKCLIFDELNRAQPKVINALLELILDKSINGRKFHNLECVVACINPPASEDEAEDESYMVGQLDPAHIDRFHFIVKIPDAPSEMYFGERYGHKGIAAVNWWKRLDSKMQKMISPRRLEMAIQIHEEKENLMYALPPGSNPADLETVLNADYDQELYSQIIANPSVNSIRKAFAITSFFAKYGDKIMENASLWQYVAAFPQESIFSLIKKNKKFKNWIAKQENDFCQNICQEYTKIHGGNLAVVATKVAELKHSTVDDTKPVKMLSWKEPLLSIKFPVEFDLNRVFMPFDGIANQTDFNEKIQERSDGMYAWIGLENQNHQIIRADMHQNKFFFTKDLEGFEVVPVTIVAEDDSTRPPTNEELDYLFAFCLVELEATMTGKYANTLNVDNAVELFRLFPILLKRYSHEKQAVILDKIRSFYINKWTILGQEEGNSNSNKFELIVNCLQGLFGKSKNEIDNYIEENLQ